MSVKFMLWALDQSLPEGLKLLLVALATFANDEGTDVYPGVEKLAAMTSVDQRTVQRRLLRLRALGVIQIETAGGGRKRATHYRLNRETVTRVSGFPPSETPTPASGFGAETPALTTGNGDRAVSPESSESESPPSRTHEAEPRADPDPFAAPETPILAFLASVGATVQPNGNGYHRHVVRLVERHGADRVLEVMKRLYATGKRTDRQLVFGAEDELDPVGGTKKRSKGIAGVNVREAVGAFRG